MNAYVLENGDVLYPKRFEFEDGGVGDGWALAPADSDEATAWLSEAQPLPDNLLPLVERLRAQRDD